MFKFIPSSFKISLIVKPCSAIIEIPGLSSSLVRKPLLRVSSITDFDPTQTGEMQHIPPFGVHTTRNLTVSCCLYWLHVDECMKRPDGISMKTSLPSIMAYVAGEGNCLCSEYFVSKTSLTYQIAQIMCPVFIPKLSEEVKLCYQCQQPCSFSAQSNHTRLLSKLQSINLVQWCGAAITMYSSRSR